MQLADNYLFARLQNRPSTALFWYLPEPPCQTALGFHSNSPKQDISAPPYLIDYRQKLRYPLENSDGIIVLPYPDPTGVQINPEAAFQYALGLHTRYYHENDSASLKKFLHYAEYFLEKQGPEGNWPYEFDWFASKAPWSSALAQARGASVMLRAFLLTGNSAFAEATEMAVSRFAEPILQGGFLCEFSPEKCHYFEEYPKTPTGVINGFMASLISIWDISQWMDRAALTDLWYMGIDSLEKMLPWYSTGWWSLYDRDPDSPLQNVNSQRYHFLEMHYLQILGLLSGSKIIAAAHDQRVRQFQNPLWRMRATVIKIIRKILYR